MNLDCLCSRPRSPLFYKLGPKPTEALTLEAWIRLDPDGFALLFEWVSGDKIKGRRGALRLTNKGELILLNRSGDAVEQEILTEKNVGVHDAQWHHLAVVFDSRRIAIFRDGQHFADKRLQLAEPPRIKQGGPTMWGLDRPGHLALMHEARVWGRALSEDEISASMRSASAQGLAGLLFESELVEGAIFNRVSGERLPVTGTVRANHPFFVRAQTGANDYVISGTDVTLTQDMLPAGQDVAIFADTITLSSPLVLKGNNLWIFARLMTATAGASIDLSGNPGADQTGQAAKGSDATTPGATGGTGTTGATGGQGQNGGNLTLLLGALNGQLPVTSNGGDGGQGQDGGLGGGGAQGVTGNDASGSFGGGGCGHCDDGSIGGQGGNGGTGGDAGPSGNGGNGGTISLTVYTALRPNQDGLTTTLNPGQPSSQSASPGLGGAFGPGGLGGRTYDEHCDSFGVCYCGLSDDRVGSGPPGAVGAEGGQAAAASAGTPGQFVSSQASNYAAFQDAFPLSLAHRVLRKAELTYFNSDFPSAATLLSWLSQAVPAGTGTSDDEWTCFGQRVATLVDQLRKGLNFYGMRRNRVPLTHIKTYLSTLQGLLIAGGTIEADYHYFTDKNNDTNARLAKIKDQLNGLTASIGQLQDAIKTASDLEAPTNAEIATLNTQVLAQYDVLLAADVAFQSALTAQANCASFEQLLTAAKGIAAMSDGDFGDVGDTGRALVNLGEGASDLPGIVQQIPTITYTDPGSTAAIQSTWNSLQTVITPNTPDAGKMAITLDEFDELLQPYLNLPEAVNYLLAMHTYVALTQAYNQKILTYDALVVRIAQLNATIALKQAEYNRVSALLANTANQDPDLPDYVAYMEGVYQDMLNLLLNYLFEANAALDYYTLDQTPIKVGTPGQPLTMADISSVFATIDVALPKYINGSAGPQQTFEDLQVSLSPAPAGSFSSGNDPFAAFIKGFTRDGDTVHSLLFSVPVDPSPLPGLYQIIGTAFTISVPGFKTTENALMIRLIHSGRAPFLDANGNRVEFSHRAEEVFYSYLVDSHGNPTKTGGGSLGGGNVNPDYIGLSPCTGWTLEIRESENSGLDLSAVNQVLINFSGLCSLTAQPAEGPQASSRRR